MSSDRGSIVASTVIASGCSGSNVSRASTLEKPAV
jgi:hypothetical protein